MSREYGSSVPSAHMSIPPGIRPNGESSIPGMSVSLSKGEITRLTFGLGL